MQHLKPRILLTDDHVALRDEVSRLLSGDFDVVGTAGNAAKLLEIAADLKPDVVVSDYKMPGLDGIRAGASLLANGFCKAVVLLTLYDDRHLFEEAQKAGILGFVLKRNAAEEAQQFR